MEKIQEVLQTYKSALIPILARCDVKFVDALAFLEVIPSSVHENLKTLDYDKLEHSRVKSRYLIEIIYKHVMHHSSTFYNFLNVLSQFDFSANFSLFLHAKLFGHEAELYYRNVPLHHVPILTSALAECAHKWEQIGIALGLPVNAIEDCRSGQSSSIRLHKVLIKWHEQTEDPSLVSIKNVLKDEIVGLPVLADCLGETICRKIESTMPILTQPNIETPEVDSQSVYKAEVSDGKSMLLGVEVPDCQSVSYQWKMDGNQLPDYSNDSRRRKDKSSPYSGVGTSILFIKNVHQGMQGKYSCIMKQGSEIIKKDLYLTINYCPWKKRLLERYASCSEVPKDSWPPVGTSKYIELALISEKNISTEYDYSVEGDIDDILKGKHKRDYKKLFNMYNSGKLVLVEGRPGSGKTTLAHKLARDWATKPDILEGANLLFLISVRILNSRKCDETLFGILRLFYHEEHASEVTKMLERSYGDGACFIIDGLDEYHNPSSLITRLLKKEYLPEAMIIVASRPIGSAELRHSENVFQRIEVLGFSREQISKYIKEYPFQADIAAELEAYLNSHIEVLHMCYLPVHTAMICYIYKSCKRIPNTVTKVYETFTLLTIKRKLQREGSNTKLKSFECLDSATKHYFDRICELAYDMTCVCSKQTILQSETEVDLTGGSGSDKFSLGLVTVDSTAQWFGFEDLYAFLHLTFQEYLAALYIAEQDEDEQLRIIETYQHKKELLRMWRFYCGIVKFESTNDRQLELIMGSNAMNDMNRIRCAYESQQQRLCFYILRDKLDRLIFKDLVFAATDFKALNYVSSNVASVTVLALENCVLNHSGITNTSGNVDGIKKLCFSNESIEQFKLLNLWLAKFPALEILDLSQQLLEKDIIEAVSNNLVLPSLNILKIKMPLLNYEAAQTLSLLSFSSCRLDQIQYYYVPSRSVHMSHKKCLSYLLKSFQCHIVPLSKFPGDILSDLDVDLSKVTKFLCLSTLILINCNMNDFQLPYLMHAEIMFETLRLDVNKITDVGAECVAELVRKLPGLQHLSLSCNNIGDQGATALANALRDSNNLIELDLQCNAVGDQGAVVIAKNLKECPKSFKLRLWNFRITRSGAKSVLEHRTGNEILEEKPECILDIVRMQDSTAMSQAFKCCRHLCSLNLDIIRKPRWQGLSRGLSSFCDGLKYCVSLKNLELSGHRIGEKGMEELAEGLQPCNLEYLGLQDNCIGDQGAAALARWLRHFTGDSSMTELCGSNLKVLDLSSNCIGTEGAAALAYGLKYCNSLESLNLQFNSIDGDGAQALVKALENCLLLHTLTLNNNRFEVVPKCVNIERFNLGHNKVSAFSIDELKVCCYLQYLDLTDNHIYGKGARALGMSLQSWKYLCELKISNNYIGWHIKELVNGLKCCGELRVLSIQNNHICHEGTLTLFKGLTNCKKLQILELDSNELNISSISALLDMVKSCTNIENLSLVSTGIDDCCARQLVDGLISYTALLTLNIQKNSIRVIAPLIGKLPCCIINTDKGMIRPAIDRTQEDLN